MGGSNQEEREMGKRKGRKEATQDLVSAHENGEDGEEEAQDTKGERFFACYLLTSLCPRYKGHTYIGFTVNPRRRIRQHNGEIRSGAWRTKQKRPWEMVLCIHGFPTNVAALQFEWAWQHPEKSLAVRAAAASFKSLSGLANKIKLAYTMLSLPAWQSLNLTVNFFSTKYQMHTRGCPNLPGKMRTQVCSMDDLPCYNENASMDDEWEVEGEFYMRDSSFQEALADESTEVTMRAHDYSPNDGGGSPKENVPIQMNQKEHTSWELSSQCLEDTWRERLREHQVPSLEHIDDSPVRVSSSSVTISSDVASYVKENQIRFDNSLQKQSITAYVADKDQCPTKGGLGFCCEVEVIDVSTPSPCYTTNPVIKKRRTNGFPEIIDLTKSPIF